MLSALVDLSWGMIKACMVVSLYGLCCSLTKSLSVDVLRLYARNKAIVFWLDCYYLECSKCIFLSGSLTHSSSLECNL
jgi:hypothetical protein